MKTILAVLFALVLSSGAFACAAPACVYAQPTYAVRAYSFQYVPVQAPVYTPVAAPVCDYQQQGYAPSFAPSYAPVYAPRAFAPVYSYQRSFAPVYSYNEQFRFQRDFNFRQRDFSRSPGRGFAPVPVAVPVAPAVNINVNNFNRGRGFRR